MSIPLDPDNLPPAMDQATFLYSLERYRAGDVAAGQRIVEGNIRLVYYVVSNRYRSLPASDRACVEFRDLVQEGTFGLYDAMRLYDPKRGFKFSTYATRWIWKYVYLAVDCERLDPCSTMWRPSFLRDPSEIDDYEEMAESVPDTGPAVHDLAERRVDSATTAVEIRAAVAKLRPAEAKVITLLYGLSDGKTRTLVEVGAIMGVSDERVRVIRNQGAALLKSMLSDPRDC